MNAAAAPAAEVRKQRAAISEQSTNYTNYTKRFGRSVLGIPSQAPFGPVTCYNRAVAIAGEFDIVVIGGGHAGAEAARAAAALGARTALVTLSAGTIAHMSCNPAIGGLAKGQIVREIDALGGLMGQAADATGIQFRVLNRSRGPAVWGPRCQSDRHAYSAYVRDALAALDGLSIIEGEATEIVTDGGRVAGVKVVAGDGTAVELPCRAAVVTAGTFLRGLMHRGERMWPGGRHDEPAAGHLSASLERLGIRLARLKTGTCPRIDGRSIDHARCARQDGDRRPAPFSFMNDSLDVEQVPCWITATNEAIHELIRANFHRAPLFTGQIAATGPRYCPSLELKVQRFADKPSHQVFIEPEGLSTDWVYLNGVATSLPVDVQERIVRLLPGLERAKVLRWGYAIEYDYADPTQLTASLEAKAVGGLFLAGQVNGTTGYEEAAGQGLVAGVNAAATLRGAEPMVLRRDQAYIGVMIDDLVIKGVIEPYRMFTSRAEYRLLLRADNADRRLTPVGREIGLVGEQRWERFLAKRSAVEQAGRMLQAARSVAEELTADGADVEALLESRSDTRQVAGLLSLWREHPQAVETAAIDCRYAGYVARQQAAAEGLAQLEARRIPDSLDYGAVAHLRAEARERLVAVRPRTLGQALRLSGVTPADVTVLMVHLGAAGRG